MRINKDNPQRRKPKQKRVDNRIRDRKDLQEVLQENDRKEQLQEELQGYYYSQSSKCSSVSRKLIMGMLAIIWLFIYTDGNIAISNNLLLYTIFLCILYLIIDVLQYFLDSISYHKAQYQLDKYMTIKDINDSHEPFMNHVNKRSYSIFIMKFIVLCLSSLLFIIYIGQKLFL